MKKENRGVKKKIAVVIIVILVTAITTAFLVYDVYFKEEPVKKTTSSSSSKSSGPSVPSRCSLVAKNDTYVRPDFQRLKQAMQNQQIVKDVPESGSISLRFFHFTDGCRIYDKSYIISDGKITEGGGKADIYVILRSDYAEKITGSNFCDVVKQSRDNGDLGQWSEIGEATLLWRYKGMLKYRECLGIKLTG
jgi:hypothetical protein